MRFGVSAFVTDEGIRPDVLGRACEERGFESLFVAEHSHMPAGSTAPDGSPLGREFARSLDPFVALTAVASATRTLRVGTAVALLVQRDVLHTAKEVATLQLLSGGRVLLGVGAGWNRTEMRHHGVDPGTRGRLLDEQLVALRRLWTDETAEFHGDHVDFGPVHTWPKPDPLPPVLVGGHSAAAVRRALDHGDGWYPITVTPQDVARVRAEAAARGRALSVTVGADSGDPAELERFALAGAERATFHLETLPESDTLRRLDDLAAHVEEFRGRGGDAGTR